MSIEYPVKHGQINGSSIWKEYEIMECMMLFEHVKKKGKWLELNKEATIIKDSPFLKDMPESFDGKNKLLKFLDKSPEISSYFYDKYKAICAK
jgi:hypothetical protein